MQNIDLTLNDIKIPAFRGYTPPFGTMVTRGLDSFYDPPIDNKGGLNIQQVNDNIIAPFVKMRAQVVSDNAETTQVEYDAKLHINAAAGVTISLNNASYEGCKVTIINPTNYGHSLSCVYVNGSPTQTYTILPNAVLKIVWNGSRWVNMKAPAVGELFVQYPQEKSPSVIFPCTYWEEVTDYGGAFFRASGGDAKAFISELPQGHTLAEYIQEDATKLNGLSISMEQVQTGERTLNPTFSATSSHGHDLYLTTGFWQGSWQNIIMQGEDYYGEARYIEGSPAYTISSYSKTISGKTGGDHTHKYTASGTIQSTDTETIPSNFTVKFWKRMQ